MALPIAVPQKGSDSFSNPLYRQVGALCWRQTETGKEVLLVTSSSGRWIIPKGWPMSGKTALEAVQIEAWEEAGVKRAKGKDKIFGHYLAVKRTTAGDEIPGVVDVYALRVLKTVKDYPEVHKRARQWLPLEEAAQLVDEDGLRQLILSL